MKLDETRICEMKKIVIKPNPCKVCGAEIGKRKKTVSLKRELICHRKKCQRESKRLAQKERRKIRRENPELPFIDQKLDLEWRKKFATPAKGKNHTSGSRKS